MPTLTSWHTAHTTQRLPQQQRADKQKTQLNADDTHWQREMDCCQLPRDGQEKISTKPPRPPSIQVSSGALPSMVTAVGSA